MRLSRGILLKRIFLYQKRKLLLNSKKMGSVLKMPYGGLEGNYERSNNVYQTRKA